MPSRAIVWLIPILLTLHNGEEAISFGRFIPKLEETLPVTAAALARELGPSGFISALLVLSALAFLLAFVVVARPRSQTALWLLLTLEMAVALNVVVHLATAVFIFRGYGPGLVTAAAINLPFAIYCFRRASSEEWLSHAALRATLPGAVVLHGPVLLAGLWLTARINR